MSEPFLVSCHIPKAAGNSLLRLLQSRYGTSVLQYWPQAPPISGEHYRFLRDAYAHCRALDSHALRHVDTRSFWPEARFLVVLREPVERAFSFYHFTRHYTKEWLHTQDENEREAWAQQNFPSVAEWSQSFSNYMTRFLSWRPFRGELDSDALSDACRALSRYDYVGVCEQMDRIPAMLAPDFPELAPLSVPVVNPTPTRSPHERWVDRHSAQDVAAVRAANRLDLDLYERAMERLGRRA